MRNFKNITALSVSDMQLLKGGASAVSIAVQAALAAGATGTAVADVATSVVADDKRPPRPGGGISTL